ncbi:MAG: tagaturonate reductase [Gemmatimonadaceae bacterium]
MTDSESSARPQLSTENWPVTSYRRDALPERVLQFGTGMLLRALPAACVDAANRRGELAGRIVIVQSTPHGSARTLNAQGGLYTLVERGIEGGLAVERVRPVGSVSRVLVADSEWGVVRGVAASPELRAIVSNVTEAGFRATDAATWRYGEEEGAPESFPAKLTDLLYTRFRRLPAAPSLAVIPTELIADNGKVLAAMVDTLAEHLPDRADFRRWLAERVRFASSLVDRITTGAPSAEARADLESRLGYWDPLLTVTEPYALWAIEADPAELREILPVDGGGGDSVVVVERDITVYRERKVRLLNGAHTALAPLALLAGVGTVRAVTAHAELSPFLHRLLFDEIIPSTDLPAAEADAFARAVVDRFRNPWLDHEWRVIATNSTSKMRLRVVPSIVGYAAKTGSVPAGLALAFAAYVRLVRCTLDNGGGSGAGIWRNAPYPVRDADLRAVARHWGEEGGVGGPVDSRSARRVVAAVLSDAALWGERLDGIPGLEERVTSGLVKLDATGPVEAVRDVMATAAGAVTA